MYKLYVFFFRAELTFDEVTDDVEDYKASWMTQYTALLWRSWLGLTRDPVLVKVTLLQNLVSLALMLSVRQNASTPLHFQSIKMCKEFEFCLDFIEKILSCNPVLKFLKSDHY